LLHLCLLPKPIYKKEIKFLRFFPAAAGTIVVIMLVIASFK
jgi:hypothetical protein